MKLGILQCDRVREELAAHGQYPERFATLLMPIYNALELVIFDVEHDVFPQDIHEVDAYLITGSRHGVNDGLPWITRLEAFVRELDKEKKKIIGICFGHQIIAKALGGKAIKSPKGWGVGVSQNRIDAAKPWMHSEIKEFNLLVSHQDQVVELPDGAEVLASSDFCPFYMIQIGNHILTIQGHPEFTKVYSHELLHFRREALTESVFLKGLESLDQNVDDKLVAQWIMSFLIM
jgi:GMP synthase-like glutamine amidotransferase